MKLIIDIPKEKYEWIKAHNLNIDNGSIVGAVANGTPYEERPHFIDNCDMNVFEPEKYMEGGAE